MVAIALHGGHEVTGVIVPKSRIAEPVGAGIAPDRGFFHHEKAELIGDVVPRLIPGLSVEPDGDVVPVFDVLQDFGDLVGGLEIVRRPGGGGEEVNGDAVQIELAAVGPEFAKAEPGVDLVGAGAAADGGFELVEVRVQMAPVARGGQER